MFCCCGTKYSLYSHDALYSYRWLEGGRAEDVYQCNNSFIPSNLWGQFLRIWRGNIFHISKSLHFMIKAALH